MKRNLLCFMLTWLGIAAVLYAQEPVHQEMIARFKSNGATDNADAVAGSMEAMRILKAVGIKPKRTIRLGILDGEEQGLLGSNRCSMRAPAKI